jgi:hypothetical protein
LPAGSQVAHGAPRGAWRFAVRASWRFKFCLKKLAAYVSFVTLLRIVLLLLSLWQYFGMHSRLT